MDINQRVPPSTHTFLLDFEETAMNWRSETDAPRTTLIIGNNCSRNLRELHQIFEILFSPDIQFHNFVIFIKCVPNNKGSSRVRMVNRSSTGIPNPVIRICSELLKKPHSANFSSPTLLQSMISPKICFFFWNSIFALLLNQYSWNFQRFMTSLLSMKISSEFFIHFHLLKWPSKWLIAQFKKLF